VFRYPQVTFHIADVEAAARFHRDVLVSRSPRSAAE
jgi:hypothetical protein